MTQTVDQETQKMKELWAESKRLIPGGVNSPVRAYQAVGMDPIFIERGEGSIVWDVDGRQYIDYVMGWGPLILGHAHPEVRSAQRTVLSSGTGFGMPTTEELELTKRVTLLYPSIEKLRLVNSGTEATMTALRLARAKTGREGVVKFDGCYHGHVDALLVKAGSGNATLGEPNSEGVPKSVAQNTWSIPFNDADTFRELMREKADRVAAVIVEPIAGNMGVIPGKPDFLKALREETQKSQSLLIFDEVMCGFRVMPAGIQEQLEITPDLTLLGKILGGGLPIGAVGGRSEIMDLLSPMGPVYQAGTFSGNRLSVASGIAALDTLMEEGFYTELDQMTVQLVGGIKERAKAKHIPVCIHRYGSMFSVFFSAQEVSDFSVANKQSRERFSQFFKVLLEKGVLIAPSCFEAWFVSGAHTERDIEQTLEAIDEAFGRV
jgi:glutamate-1-semialdehyde 2,1-aminomutase